jgi:hypothetical protein
MAVVSKSLDELTTQLTDDYDSLITPRRVWRDNRNKLYLVFRGIAGGLKVILDAVIASKNRFNPLHCDEDDLLSTCKLVGTDIKQGTGSILKIIIANTSAEERTFPAGGYRYTDVSGMPFSFELAVDYLFEGGESRMVSAISANKGSYRVTANTSIKLTRADGAGIDPDFSFACFDNSGQLGYPDEDLFSLRQRIVNDADRQDHIKELELKIRNLPNIHECSLVFNPGLEAEYDGIMLAPRELLVTITGVPTDKIAELVAGEVHYLTHMVDPDLVVYYYNDLYVDGRFPVYYRYHTTVDFSLEIMYRYNSTLLKSTQVDAAISELFLPYKHMTTHIGVFSEEDVYNTLADLGLPGVRILNAVILDGTGNVVPYVEIPKTRLPRLTGIVYSPIAQEEGGVQ